MGCCSSTRFFLLAPALWLGLAGGACASVGSRSAVADTSPVPTLSQTPAPAQGSPPESGTSDQLKTDQYRLSHDRYEKAVAYSRASYTLYFVWYALSVAVLVFILRWRVAAKFRDLAERISGNHWIQGIIFVPLLLLTCDLLDLPIRIYWHLLSLRYQQSIQSWGEWFGDWTKGELLAIAFGVVLALILSAAMRRSPRRWWLYFWFPAVLILLGLVLITPLVIDPLFNKFEPLGKDHPELVSSIQKLTNHAGVPIPPERMFLMTASRKTNTINAYVTGLGASKRVVIWDTLIQKTTNDEALFIVGHELGHYALDHVLRGTILGAAGLLLALYLLFRGLHWCLGRWGGDWSLNGAEDWASLAVLLLLLQVLLFLASPAINAVSRYEEHAADVYGLEVIHGLIPDSEEVAAHAFQVIGELDLADPNPPAFVKFWLYSHPPLAERLVFAYRYDPWSKGQRPKYVQQPHW